MSGVAAASGPFTYVRYTHAGGRWRKFFPFAPKVKIRHPDLEFVARTIPAQDLQVCSGPAGTLIFCDTSGIHRGGYATQTPRIMYTSVYTTRASARATRFSYAPGFRPAALGSPLARYAVHPTSL